MAEGEGWIGVDLDGTLAIYDRWRGPEHIGAPITRMVERVKRWLAEGADVRIFTARVADDPDERARQAISMWCLAVFGQLLPITNVKDHGMAELWDDRAVQVARNTGEAVGR